MANRNKKYFRFKINHSRIIEIRKTKEVMTEKQGIAEMLKLMEGQTCFAISIL